MLPSWTLIILRTHFKHFLKSLWLPILYLHLPLLVECKSIEGTVHSQENWMFITRFCFYSNTGHFTFRIVYPWSFAVQKILLYYDSPSQWQAVYKKPLTCEEKESVLSRENNQFINLSLEDDLTCRLVDQNGTKHVLEPLLDCTGERFFQTARERWWFIAISNCNSTKGLKFNYIIKMTNGVPGDIRHEHFSADEFGILEMSLAFMVLLIILLIMAVCSAVALHQRHLLHRTYKLYLISLAIYTVSLVCLSMAYCRYAVDGKGLPKLLLWGKLLQAASGIVFLTLLLVLAKGYTVTRARLRFISVLKIGFFVTVYSFTVAALFIYKEQLFDPGEVLYMYESPAGHGLIVLKLLSWAMFICSIVFTLKHYPEKALFYFPFLAFYTLWFIAGPLVILFANYVIDKWVREKAVFGVEVSITFLAFLIFWCLTIPTFNNINFPYHVRTTQIGIIFVQTDGDVVASNLDNFHHHNYAPSAQPVENVSNLLTNIANNHNQELGLYVIGPQRNHPLAPSVNGNVLTNDSDSSNNNANSNLIGTNEKNQRASCSAMRPQTPPPPYDEGTQGCVVPLSQTTHM